MSSSSSVTPATTPLTSASDDRFWITLPAEQAPLPLGCYSHAAGAGGFVFLCGMGARDPVSGKEVGVTLDAHGQVVQYDIRVQTHAVIQNIIRVLDAAGCTLADVVDVQVFLRHMGDFTEFNTIYGEYFTMDHPPARTTIEAAPPGHNFIEVKAVAYKPACKP